MEIIKVTPSFAGMDSLRTIYEEAFPVEERFTTIDSMIEHGADVSAYQDDGVLVGLSVIFHLEWFDYLLFFAVNSQIRSKGYGGIIFDNIVASAGERPLYFSVEDPDETPVENIEQRIKRVNFYQKHGYTLSDSIIPGKPRFRLMGKTAIERIPEAVDFIREQANLYMSR